jgi:2-beta-glucuronyltransferase
MPPLAVVLSYHHPASKRRAGFHFISDELEKRGFDVLFVTCSFSSLNRLKASDHRRELAPFGTTNTVARLSERRTSFVWEPLFHPVGLGNRSLDRLASPLFLPYRRFFPATLVPHFERANLAIVESCAGLSLIPRIRQINPRIKLIYRASDDLPSIGAPPLLCRIEREILPIFDWVSAPCQPLLDRLRRDGARMAASSVNFHGVDTEAFDRLRPEDTPYTSSHNAVYVGISTLDQEWVRHASRLAPHWHFHLIGPFTHRVQADNVHYLGEIPFRDTVRYIRFADYGLHTLKAGPALWTYTDTLKVQQYAYCNLPTLAPSELHAPHRHFFQYTRNDPSSILAALRAAENARGTLVAKSAVGTWANMVDFLLEATGTAIPTTDGGQ